MVKPDSLSKRSRTISAKPAKRKVLAPQRAGKSQADRNHPEAPAPISKSAGTSTDSPGDTETRILTAARREFIAKGQDGARMQVIADEAGVNKALLHYYYRSKANLYRKVLEVTLATVWGRVKEEFNAQAAQRAPAPGAGTLEAGAPLSGLHGLGVENIVKTFVSTFIRTLSANPDFPLFVFREIAGGGATFPVVLQELMKNFKDIPVALIQALQQEAKAGLIKPVHPLHFLMNMMGMTVTTFLAIPMLSRLGPAAGFKFDLDDAFFETRIHSITDTLLNGIRIRK